MCIALFSTAHPYYELIVISNRDEYLTRPTAPAEFWKAPDDQVLGGRDLLRLVQGTWLGITRQGRLAVLTNFREEGQIIQEARSRGAIANAFLTQDKNSSVDTADFARNLLEGDGVTGVGGFSLVCGKVGQPLAVISNRTPDVDGVTWIARERGQTVGLSNAAFDNRSWPKVLEGEKLLQSTIESSLERWDTEEVFVEELMKLLSTDSLPKREQGQGFESYVKELRHSIFIPAVGGEGADLTPADEIAASNSEEPMRVHAGKHGLSGMYGTQKQTVILVRHDGSITFVERTLYDQDAQPVSGYEKDRTFRFEIDDFKQTAKQT
ncbi:MAG: hypothetical protein Q9220_001058 [cf. Caloplaca sp. 1 TL-2023]